MPYSVGYKTKQEAIETLVGYFYQQLATVEGDEVYLEIDYDGRITIKAKD